MKKQDPREDLKEGFDCAAGMDERIEETIAAKKAENCVALGKLRVAEASWKKMITERDREAAGEITRVNDELAVVGEAKLSLGRHVRLRIDKASYGIAGRVVDRDSGIGLPELRVDVVVSPPGKPEFSVRETTDRSGSFFIRIPMKRLSVPKKASTRVTFSVTLPPNTVVHEEEVLLKPKAGKTDDVTLSTKHTEDLSAAVIYGRRLRESVESDEQLVKLRGANIKAAYSAFSHLCDATLSSIRDLRSGLSADAAGGVRIPEEREAPVGPSGGAEPPVGEGREPTKQPDTSREAERAKEKERPKEPHKEKEPKPAKKKPGKKPKTKEEVKPTKEKAEEKPKKKKEVKPAKKKVTEKSKPKKKVKPAKKKVKLTKKKAAKKPEKKKVKLTKKALGKLSKVLLKKKNK